METLIRRKWANGTTSLEKALSIVKQIKQIPSNSTPKKFYPRKIQAKLAHKRLQLHYF